MTESPLRVGSAFPDPPFDVPGPPRTGLDDLEAGTLGAFMKLEPVMRWLTADRPHLGVVHTAVIDELLAVAVATDDTSLAQQIDTALDALRASGELAALGTRWLHGSDPAATAVVT